MDWVNQSLRIHSTFGSLGFTLADRYHINDNCNVALERILQNILSEDKSLRTYRRSISFGQNINRDLIPLLMHAKEDKTIELLVKILANLSIPIEYLYSVDVISLSHSGQHIISEVNDLLAATKAAFADREVTKIVIDFLRKNIDFDKNSKLPIEQRENVSSSLLLLRNILHTLPVGPSNPNQSGSAQNMQNQVIWNMFSQSIDKMLIKLMTVSDATDWAATLVQLIAQLYQHQSDATLRKLLNVWLETPLSDTSEDIESNTSRKRCSDSSPMLTSEPTSDSSDTRGTSKCPDESDCMSNGLDADSVAHTPEGGKSQWSPRRTNALASTALNPYRVKRNLNWKRKVSDMKLLIEVLRLLRCCYFEGSHPCYIEALCCFYVTRTAAFKTPAELNVQGLSRKNPTDDYMSIILKEFMIDFLLKGYNSLVHTLHGQILARGQTAVDTSHLFWLLTYFLKFATQIEVDLEQVSRVLSFDMIACLTAEAVDLCEQFELAIKLDGPDLKLCIRRLHLVVTAIREFIKAIEEFGKFKHLSETDRDILTELQIKMHETEDLRSLLVLLLRHYNPQYLSTKYLQDLIVTNHILLLCLDRVMKMPEYKGPSNMVAHVKQFATPLIMNNYGTLLENYRSNGGYVNECIFTMMHHVGGEIGCPATLLQPKILKSFASILTSHFEICDDWSDLIHYVTNTFKEKPHSLYTRPEREALDTGGPAAARATPQRGDMETSAGDKWSKDELSFLSWNYVQCRSSSDVVGDIVQLLKENGITKSKDAVISELFRLNLVGKDKYETLLTEERNRKSRKVQLTNEERKDELNEFREQLAKDGKADSLDWVQKVLLETCFAKIYIDEKASASAGNGEMQVGLKKFGLFKNKANGLPELSPVSYHALNHNRSVPLVPWNCAQANVCKDLKFLQFLFRIGFHMPVDTGKVFIRIPDFWTADILYDVAEKIMPIDTSKLKFSVNGLLEAPMRRGGCIPAPGPARLSPVLATRDHFSQMHQHLATMVHFSSTVSETASAASDHTLMFVSDEDEELELTQPAPAAEEPADDAIPAKRRRT